MDGKRGEGGAVLKAIRATVQSFVNDLVEDMADAVQDGVTPEEFVKEVPTGDLINLMMVSYTELWHLDDDCDPQEANGHAEMLALVANELSERIPPRT